MVRLRRAIHGAAPLALPRAGPIATASTTAAAHHERQGEEGQRELRTAAHHAATWEGPARWECSGAVAKTASLIADTQTIAKIRVPTVSQQPKWQSQSDNDRGFMKHGQCKTPCQ